MKKNIKHISLALLALGLSSPAFADNCSPFAVTAVNQQGGFTISADALYLQPRVGFGGYNISLNSPVGTTINGTVNNVDPSYHWGFDVTAGYRFPCTSNDVTVTWTDLPQKSDSDNTTLLVASTTPFGTLPTGTYNLTSTGTLQFNYDAVDADLGHRVSAGDFFQYRMFAGVRWAQVEADKSILNVFRQVVTVGTPAVGTESIEQDSKFDGIGPQVGLDGRFCLGYGFGIDANLIASVLVGQSKSDFVDALPTPETGGAIATTRLNNNDKDRIVPAIDASLGLDYTYNFNNCDRSNIVIQAGWKVINYFDAVQPLTNTSTFSGGSTGFVTGAIGGNDSHNVGFQGPYAGIKVNL